MGKLYNFLNRFFKKSPKVSSEIIKRSNSIEKKSISIISNNCLAGVIYHDYGLKFESPVINCFISWLDFPFFIMHLKDYLEVEIKENKIENRRYPVGVLELSRKINVYFNHDKKFILAKNKWEERKKRVNFDNILVIVDTFGKKLSNDYINELLEISKKYKLLCLYSIKENGVLPYDFFVKCELYEKKYYDSGKICQYKYFSGKRYYEDYLNANMIFENN